MKLIINGEKIDNTMINEEIELLRPEYMRAFQHQTPEEQEAQLQDWAKENVYEKVLLRQTAQKDPRKIPDKKVDEAFKKLKDEHGGEDQFYQKFDIKKNENKKIKKDLELQLRIERLINDINKDVPLPNKKQANSFYIKNKNSFMTLEQVRSAHIVKNIDAIKTEKQAKKEILGIQKQLKAGKSFEQLADENSDCPGNGGDLGYFPRGQMVQNFEDVVFSMKKNQVSDVFQTEFGYHIAKVHDRKPTQLMPFENVVDKIIEQLHEENKNSKLEKYIDELKEKAEIEYTPPTPAELKKIKMKKAEASMLEKNQKKYTKPLNSVLIKPAGPDCNMACSYCFYLEKKDLFTEEKVHRMSEKILEEMIKQTLQQCPREISFGWQGGEPTLMGIPFFQKAIDFQKKYSRGQTIGNGLQTNGLLINKDWTNFLKENNFLVGISLDGPEHIHDFYRELQGGGKTWKRIEDNAKLMLDAGVAVNALSVVNDYSVQYPEEIYNYHKSLGINFMQFIPIVETDPKNPAKAADFSVSEKAYGKFLNKLFDLWQADFENGVPKTSIRLFDSVFFSYVDMIPPDCSLMKECGVYVVVEHNGDIFSCDFFVEPEWKLGNIMENKLIDLLNSEKQITFGQQKSTLPEECVNCKWLKYCRGGCPKDRIRDPGDNNLCHFCEAFKMFFEHSDSTFKELAVEWKRQQGQNHRTHEIQELVQKGEINVGRNDPCPCGSGRKFKKCCSVK
jgi:uncharacterized protein